MRLDHRPVGAWLAVGLMALAVASWLWPLGVGGRMPVGGDVTRFSIGLMAELGRAYRQLRLPLWNDLWGYGFPGLAESQMGVYYPPHLVLYGLLPVEAAYTASLVLHTFWGALGAFWAARRFGASATGAAVGGFAWAASGFFVVHLPHQWGYTVGSWMPWAWGLAWPLARGEVRSRQVLLLSAVLALQILPGHFQLAFVTEVGVAVLAAWGLVERPHGLRAAIRGSGAVATAGVLAAPLALGQLWPTSELAKLAESGRGYEYLSSFSNTPLHLVSYLAPLLFHRSPMWRPIAWDPFRTTPEELLVYVGVAPLFLAIGALIHGGRRDPDIRALGALALVALGLSLGPYLPGFAGLVRLPGFSFFRAPARWGLAADLALALLAARGLSLLEDARWPRPGRSLARFAMAGACVVGLLGGFLAWRLEGASPANEGRLLSFSDTWGAIVGGGSRRADAPPSPPGDRTLVASGLLRQGIDPHTARIGPARLGILRDELGPAAVLLAALLALSLASKAPRVLVTGLVALTVADMLALNFFLRPVQTAPIRPLVDQSPVLSWLATRPRGTRIVDNQGNLAMAAGQAPIFGYRTLDRPILVELTWLASHPPWRDLPESAEARRAVGLGVGILPLWDGLSRAGEQGVPPEIPRIRDPERARWELGSPGLGLLGEAGATFLRWEPAVPDTGERAWLVPTPSAEDEDALLRQGDDTRRLLARMATARPLPRRSTAPERIEVDVDGDEPGYVMLTQLDDPNWEGTWHGPGGERPATLVRLFGNDRGAGWQAARRPGPGPWTLRLAYRSRAAERGLAVSMVAWGLWVAAYWWFGRPAPGGRTGGEGPAT